MHKIDAAALKEEAKSCFKSVYIPVFQTVIINGKSVQISGGIKSLDPPCKGEALSYGEHPYTCDNCFRQLRELKNTLQHRISGCLDGKANRLGLKGFNRRYARKGEMMDALEVETQKRKSAEGNVKQLVRRTLTPTDWEESLHQACLSGEDQMLAINLVRLLKSGISARNPMQILVLKNLTSKLQKRNNHHYVDLVKDISGLFKNELGPSNYALLADLFGLAKETTAAKHSSNSRIDPGLNKEAINMAANKFKGLPVNEASDGARCLRYLHPRKAQDGTIVLVGSAWSPDVDSWKEEEIKLPRRDASKGDVDDFGALKRLVDHLIKSNRLAKTVSIHNLTCLAALDKPTVINCMWPTQDKGYKAVHLLKYWEALRKVCYYDDSGAVRKMPLNLIGYSTDSAGFSLSAAIHLMTPSPEEIKEGVVYLGLGIDDECYLSPYYWFLPAIAFLDYDHEQRLFLKNLKYETRQLTFWEDKGQAPRLATIQHLKDLKHRCQVLGLDCGFSSTDLLLIYFCDQNSDACERLFTLGIADLLEENVPGSQGTILYITAVYSLIQPFRVPDFGSPEDVQESISCGIYILRLWKKVLELKKLRLHSQAGAKSDPSKRGHFITYGCYTTAEVLFSAATIHQLAMYLHFKGLGPQWASPYNSGTKTTERLIAELQGKTNHLQSLDSQPTFGDMLERSTKVQYNINTKQRLSTAGAKVSSSHKRKRLAFSFKPKQGQQHYEFPDKYSDFKEAQVQAHRRGVKRAQTLFAKYMPSQCVDLLKENGSWEKPFVYNKPKGCTVVDQPPPREYCHIDKSFAIINEDLESQCNEEETDGNIDTHSEADRDSFESTAEFDVHTEEHPEVEGSAGMMWKISKCVDGKMTYIHIKQGLKLLLPREYISRCRQKRHWAAQYLPGKEPLNPKHDIFKYCNVALKVVHDNTKLYDIARVEVIESTTDGSEVGSFEREGKISVRFRCSLYSEDDNGVYFVSDDVLLTKWRAPSAIISAVDLQPVVESPGKYTLHPESKALFQELGFSSRNANHDKEMLSPSEITEDLEDATGNDEEFYEVEEVLSRRLSTDSLLYEYKVRFKGYGPEDDMWLPSSFFNRPVTFESTSKYGRKRKHTLDPDNAEETPLKRRQKRRSSNKKHARAVSASKCKRVRKSIKDKGRAFRSSLETLPQKEQRDSEKISDSNVESKQKFEVPVERAHSFDDETSSDKMKKQRKTETKESWAYGMGPQVMKADMTSNCDERNTAHASEAVELDFSSNEELGNDLSILSDVARRDDNFSNTRRTLGYTKFPEVDATIRTFTCRCIQNDPGINVTDPLEVTRIPPHSLLQRAAEESRKAGSNVIVQFQSYGSFDRTGIRILQRFHRLRKLRNEVKFEEEWLRSAFQNMDNTLKNQVTCALLDRVNEEGKHLVSYKDYRLTSQDLSLMCGERYLSDEIINLLIQSYCDRANAKHHSCRYKLLPSFLSVGEVSKKLIENICKAEEMNEIEVLFLPIHMLQCHWGLAIFSVSEQTVFFDDGYHCPVSEDLRCRTKTILSVIAECTKLAKFQPLRWNEIQRFKVPMPDQPQNSEIGSGSCGVSVICAARDVCNRLDSFTWTYQDAPQLRAQLMVELINLH